MPRKQRGTRKGLGRLFRATYRDKQTGQPRMVSVWTAAYYNNGREVRVSTGTSDKQEAMRILADLQREADGNGRMARFNIRHEDMRRLVLDSYAHKGNRTIDRVRRQYEVLLDPFFGDMRLSDMTAAVMDEYAAKRLRDGVSGPTINRELAIVRYGLRLAAKRFGVPYIPVVNMFAESAPRTGFFEREELDAIKQHLSPDVCDFIDVMYLTGWRRTEVLTRKWAHVSFPSGVLRLEVGQGKDKTMGREFPLIPPLREILERRHATAKELEKRLDTRIESVFFWSQDGRPLKCVRKQWEKARVKAGLPAKRLHDFRRTAARNLELAGVQRQTAKAVIGHKTDRMYERYAIQDRKMIDEAAAKLAAFHQSSSGA